MAERLLIVNADDFGQSPGVNRGVVEAHERGIVTSASLMVRWPAAAEAAAYARGRPELSVGLHVDLGEWVCEGGAWRPLYAVPLDDAGSATDEVARQLLRFRELTGQPPTHLDSHQHVHRRDPVRSALAALARDLGIPLREGDPHIRYSGAFYGQTADGEPRPDAITVAGLIRILETFPPGLTELGCHPGYADDVHTMYRHERAREIAVLCDPRVRGALARLRIQLTSFASVVPGAAR
jgi:chitin disaccharide deacetylase